MASRKPSARAKRVAAFKAGAGDLDSLFEDENRRRDELDVERERARREKACASKMRYATRADAMDAIAACEEHGRRGLSTYRCPYCGGWHLTSHPWT
ncbi:MULTISPECIES: hypothetical protein [Enorma]|uniref:hypothetical protein n=1 Tax=Enorma TaxID=1472762 RepID=UPI000345ACF9|nr:MULTISPECIES: hypothetical protein [Enorma]